MDTLPAPLLVYGIATLYIGGMAWRPLAYSGLAAQCAYMVMRGLELGRLPLVGVHDTMSFLALSCMAFGLGTLYAMKEDGADEADTRLLMRLLALMAALFTAMAATQQPKSGYLPPVLNTYWFELHVAMSFFSYALFGIAALLGVLFLMRGAAAYERIEYKTAFIGYGLFSISMILGGVWAHLAWGTYWLWTPKELWTSLLWVYYSLYLHARLWPRMAGRPAAVMGVLGYGVVLFTYLGVGLLMKSSHSF
jgi:ABC-type transport system involved in cytochrome c biogenesis permease subunit